MRLSSAQLNKLSNELNDTRGRLIANTQESENYRARIQKLLSENSGLGE